MNENTKFIPSNPLKTAVLFLIFNRLDTTKEVFEAIRNAKPPKLYIAADGPRESYKNEKAKVEEVREYVMQNIDWKCEIKTRFSDKNMGCKYAVSSAINWFFENEEMGIILEDDCLPSPSFFWFCEELLEKYKNNDQIGMITGTNYIENKNIENAGTYFYSNHFTIWGWASWRRAWKDYDVEMRSYSDLDLRQLRYKTPNYLFYLHFKRTFDLIKDRKMNTWDIQWVYHCLMNSRLCITPTKNLISNIGVDGTHAKGKATDSHFLKRHDFAATLQHSPLTEMFFPYYWYDTTLFNEKAKPALYKGLIFDSFKKMKIYQIVKKTKGALYECKS